MERQGLTPNVTRTSRDLAREQGVGGSDGKLLRGNIKDKKGFWLNQLGQILRRQTRVKSIKSGEIRNLIRYWDFY